jgi:hypothetical protein
VAFKGILGVEVQYSQAIVAQYILKTPQDREKLHRRYMSVLRENLVHINTAISDALNDIAREHEERGEFQWQTIMAPWETPLAFMIATNSGGINRAALEQVQNAANTMTNLRKSAEQKCMDLAETMGHLDSIIKVLGESYDTFQTANAARGLFTGVPVAKTMGEQSKPVEAAAIQQIIHLKDPGIDNIVRQWVLLLETHAGLSGRMREVQQDVALKRAMVNLSALTTVLFQVKHDELQLQPSAENGKLAKDERLDTIRTHIKRLVQDKKPLITSLGYICRVEQDEEEFRTIMMIPLGQQHI